MAVECGDIRLGSSRRESVPGVLPVCEADTNRIRGLRDNGDPVRIGYEHDHDHHEHDDHDDASLGCVLLRHREPVAKGVFQCHESGTMLWFVLSGQDVFRDQLQHNDHEHDHDNEYHHEHDGTADRCMLRYQRSRHVATVCGAD
jgi:hypothetical protein